MHPTQQRQPAHPEPRELMEQVVRGQLSRRAFIARAAALGCSASAIAGYLAACGPTPTPTAAPTPPPCSNG